MILKLINKNNQELNLLDSSRFVLVGAEALHGIDTEISESDSPYFDGSIIDNVKALPRGIELTFKINSDVKNNIDYFTSIVKSKQYVTLYQKENDKEIIIKGIATIPPYTRMLSSCKLVLSVYCPQPYWEDLNYIVGIIDKEIDLLNFPVEGQYFTQVGRPFGAIDTTLEKVFKNEGDVAVGMLITLLAFGDVVNPRISCSTGEQNGWYMQLNLTLKANDELKINTVKGNKYITINGLETFNGKPILDYLEFKGLDWLQLETGDNRFNITPNEQNDNIYFTIIYKRKYE